MKIVITKHAIQRFRERAGNLESDSTVIETLEKVCTPRNLVRNWKEDKGFRKHIQEKYGSGIRYKFYQDIEQSIVLVGVVEKKILKIVTCVNSNWRRFARMRQDKHKIKRAKSKKTNAYEKHIRKSGKNVKSRKKTDNINLDNDSDMCFCPYSDINPDEL